MAGAIIENMSTKKLCIVGGILLIFQVISFLVGGLIAPRPTIGVQYLATKCVDIRKHQKSKWFMPWGPNQCEKKIQDFSEAMKQQIEANDIVFATHIPHQNWEMSSWFQFLLVVLQFEIEFQIDNKIDDDAVVTLNVSLGYRDDRVSEWTEMAHTVENRKLNCNFSSPKVCNFGSAFH